MTYSTASRSELARNQDASESPYALSPPDAATFWNPVALAEKSQARPRGCSPLLSLRKHAVYRVNPALRASWYACNVRGVRQPDVVGSFTEQDSLGQLPSGLRGAGVAEAPRGAGPAAPALPSAFSRSALRLSITATWVASV